MTTPGLRVHSELDHGKYPMGVVVIDQQMARIQLKSDRVLRKEASDFGVVPAAADVVETRLGIVLAAHEAERVARARGNQFGRAPGRVAVPVHEVATGIDQAIDLAGEIGGEIMDGSACVEHAVRMIDGPGTR